MIPDGTLEQVGSWQRHVDAMHGPAVDRYDVYANPTNTDSFDMTEVSFGCIVDDEDEEGPLRPRPLMRMMQSAYAAVMDHLTGIEPEAGGMLLGPKGSSVITHYVPDLKGKATPVSFTVDAASLNRILKKHVECGLDAKGMVHSHPRGCNFPSHGDLQYVRRAFANEKNHDLSEFFLPIVSGRELFAYVILVGDLGTIQVADLVLI